MQLIELVGSVLGTGAFTSLLTYLATRRQQTLDSETKVRDTILKVLDDERKENATCEERVTQLTGRIEELVQQNSALKQQITDLEVMVTTLRETLLQTYLKEAPKHGDESPPK